MSDNIAAGRRAESHSPLISQDYYTMKISNLGNYVTMTVLLGVLLTRFYTVGKVNAVNIEGVCILFFIHMPRIVSYRSLWIGKMANLLQRKFIVRDFKRLIV